MSHAKSKPSARPFSMEGHPLLSPCEEPAQFLVRAAYALSLPGARHEHLGRGPAAYDDVGLIREAVRALWDWLGWRGPVPDFTGYGPDHGYIPNDFRELVKSWGFSLVVTAKHGGVLREAREGDLIQYMGVGPVLGLVVQREVIGVTLPAVLAVWWGEAPEIRRPLSMSHTALALYRWTGEQLQEAASAGAPQVEGALA